MQLKRPLSLEQCVSFDKLDDEEDNYKNRSAKRRKRDVDTEWKLLSRDSLPLMPLHYAKERTSIAVSKEEPNVIADRIVQRAHLISAFGYYDGVKARATLKTDEMELTIQLFQEKSNDSTIVEIRRKSGSTILFHRAARCLLRAAKGDNKKNFCATASNLQTQSHALPHLLSASRRRVSTVEETTQNKGVESTLACTMETIDSLLRKDRLDAQLLGMQSLRFTSDAKTSSQPVTMFIAHEVIHGEVSTSSSKYIAHDKVFSLIMNKHYSKDGEGNGGNEIKEEGNIVGDVYTEKMRLCALLILKNSLEVLMNNDENNLDPSINKPVWIGENGSILSSLMKDLENADSNPEVAYLAATCLKHLMEASMQFKSRAVGYFNDTKVLVRGEKSKACSAHNLFRIASDDLLRMLRTENIF